MSGLFEGDETLQRDEVGMVYAHWHGHLLRGTYQPVFERTGNQLRMVGVECSVAVFSGGQAIDLGDFLGRLPDRERLLFPATRLAVMLGNCGDLDADLLRFVLFRLDAAAPGAEGLTRRLLEDAIDIVAGDDLSPSRLIGCVSGGKADAAGLADHLHALGVSVAIDGFGRGDDDLDLVEAWQPQLIRVDHEWFRRITEAPSALKLLGQLIEILHRQGIGVLVDKIDNASLLRASLLSGATLLQGDFLASPRLVGIPPEKRSHDLNDLLGYEPKVIPLLGSGSAGILQPR